MGAPYIDYFISDEISTPPSLQPYFSEKLVYMPHSFYVNDHKRTWREVLNQKNLPERKIFFQEFFQQMEKDIIILANFGQPNRV